MRSAWPGPNPRHDLPVRATHAASEGTPAHWADAQTLSDSIPEPVPEHETASRPAGRCAVPDLPLDLQSTIDLTIRARTGDLNALEALCLRCLRTLNRYAAGRLPSGVRGMIDTQDVVQEAVQRGLSRLNEFDTRHPSPNRVFMMTAATRRLRRASHSALAFRRSPYVVSFWDNGRLILFNYSTGVAVRGTALAIEVLDELAEWRTWDELLAKRSLEERQLLRRLVGLMVDRTFVTRSTDEPRASDDKLTLWKNWNPVAGFFHLATKDVNFGTSGTDQVALACERARTTPLPSPLKAHPTAGIRLPRANTTGDLPSVLLARRTWRRFSDRPVALAELATLLQLTWGVQRWIEVPRLGRFALKTSPSGGARHSIEVYVLARKVAGLRRGLYHYNPDTHRLAAVSQPRGLRVSDYLPGQPWYDDAGAVLLMTAVFERVQWRYPYARAYRAVLAEAGHLCQTFCLVATWLGLAPFCTMALADSRIEKDLNIDGVSESVLYAAGVGTRPEGLEWAPWPGRDDAPNVSAPTHARPRLARPRRR